MKTPIDSASAVNAQYDGSASLLNNDSEAPTPVVNDNHDSLWSHIKYGIGMLAFLVIPPFIPGITTRTIVIVTMCAIVSVYTAAGIMAVIRLRRPTGRRKMA